MEIKGMLSNEEADAIITASLAEGIGARASEMTLEQFCPDCPSWQPETPKFPCKTAKTMIKAHTMLLVEETAKWN